MATVNYNKISTGTNPVSYQVADRSIKISFKVYVPIIGTYILYDDGTYEFKQEFFEDKK